MAPDHHLTFHRYGKAEVRVVHVDRSGPRHVVRDLNVSTALRGEALVGAWTHGDNTGALPTDSQKNAVFALAREHGIGEPEDFAGIVASHLIEACSAASTAEVTIEEHPWVRIPSAGGGDSGAAHEGSRAGHDHAFTRAGAEVRTASLVLDREGGVAGGALHAGLKELVVMKSTGSEYGGFLKDRFTTLAETDERVLATSVTATWRYGVGALAAGHDFGALFTSIRSVLLEVFADVHSLALQQTLHQMGSAVLDAHAEVDEVALVMPNKHHFLVDLTPFGLDNPDAVYHADDRPYGLIEGTIARAAP